MGDHEASVDAPEALRTALARYPPPYRLTCDVAMFPIVVGEAQAEYWAGTPVVGLLGRTLLVLVAARYLSAEYGAGRTPMRFHEEHPDLYREVSCVLLSGVWPGFSFAFPRLWVDTPSPLPMELGWSYGFPKVPAAIGFQQEGNAVRVTVSDERGAVLSVGSRKGVELPPQLATGLAFGEGVFPRTGLRAKMRLEGGQRAQVLRVQEWDLPRLARWGLAGRPVGGLWLEKVTLVLEAPSGPLPG